VMRAPRIRIVVHQKGRSRVLTGDECIGKQGVIARANGKARSESPQAEQPPRMNPFLRDTESASTFPIAYRAHSDVERGQPGG